MFSGSLVAIVTPMHADGSIDWPAWERLLRMHLAAGTSGIVIGGTTGESATLLESELLELLSRARAVLQGRVPLIVGVGESSTAATVEKAQRLSAAGVDGLLVVTPAYNRPTQEGLYRHFEAVAAASEVPVVLYNVPTRTAVDLLPATVGRLARLPRIVAIKEAVPAQPVERVRELLAAAEGRLTVLSGDDGSCAQAILSGARGVISVTANVVPAAMAQLCSAALHGERELAEQIDAGLADLHQALFVETSPIPVKWLLGDLGWIESGIRLPLTPLSSNCHARVRSALERAQAARPVESHHALSQASVG
ncbi:MAG TPA: 4-hydroxy-tetrahydrodipicolinate synthase [Steroidobacteraceae bacterium]|nr:4-hydroxy-tetrahydrodipicolinate synthase [Steroidobacteraceae bacterium]